MNWWPNAQSGYEPPEPPVGTALWVFLRKIDANEKRDERLASERKRVELHNERAAAIEPSAAPASAASSALSDGSGGGEQEGEQEGEETSEEEGVVPQKPFFLTFLELMHLESFEPKIFKFAIAAL